YQRRDRIALLAFRGRLARVLLPPTNSVELAERRLRELPTGGRTPLAHALALATEVVERSRLGEPGLAPLVVLVSDGRGNVPLAGGDPALDLRRAAAGLARTAPGGLVVDVEAGQTRLGLARQLATLLGARHLPIADLAAGSLRAAIQRVLHE